jgi:hypothetical protein
MSPFSTRRLTTLHFANKTNIATTLHSKLSTAFKQLSASYWMEKLPVSLLASAWVLFKPKRFYDLNISLAKCKNNIPAQRIWRTYDTYALKANKGLRLGWRSILRKIPVHRCWKVFSALPQCADRDTKWTFSVDTFTSTKSTHWKNSNILATCPKVHNSMLNVNIHGSVHRSMTLEKQPTRCNLVIEYIIPPFMGSWTCFKRHTAHH